MKIYFVCTPASRPRLRMDETRVSLSDSVSFTCSVTYRSQLKVTLTLTEASRTVNVTHASPGDGDNCRVSATVPVGRRQSGLFRCLVAFTQQDRTKAEFAQNRAELSSRVVQVGQPMSPDCEFLVVDR